MQMFLSGAIAMGFLASGLFFITFHKRTKDRLFLTFVFAFWILAAERFVLSFMEGMNENTTFVYVLRLFAFSLIIYAVVDKNKSPNEGSR